MTERTSVHVLTGFLGSGKTTLLRHILASPDFADCAVLVNEFGEIGVDHHLIAELRGDVALLQSGCICCTIRGDLAQAIRRLHAQKERGEMAFARLVIETTGLADPAPILGTILHDPQLRHHFRLAGVLATVDAVNGPAQLDRQPESVQQVAAADRIVVTKCDLADATALDARLAHLNPLAPRWHSANAPPPAELLLRDADLSAPARFAARVAAAAHDARVHAFVLTIDEAVDWDVFAVWFTLLLHAHGADILRVKGLLRVAGADGPVAVDAVQHLVHPPRHLAAWPADWQGSHLVFIVRDLARADVGRSLATFQAALAASKQ